MVLSACEVVRLGLWWKIGIWFSAHNFLSRFHLPINEVPFWSPWLGLSAQYLNDAITHVLTELCTKNWKWTFWGKFWLVRTKKGSLTLGLRILRDQNFDLVTNLQHHRRICEYFDQKASLWAIGNFPDFGKFPKIITSVCVGKFWTLRLHISTKNQNFWKPRQQLIVHAQISKIFEDSTSEWATSASWPAPKKQQFLAPELHPHEIFWNIF